MNSILSKASRIGVNLLILGSVCAASMFLSTLASATSSKVVDSLVAEFKREKSESDFTDSKVKKAA